MPTVQGREAVLALCRVIDSHAKTNLSVSLSSREGELAISKLPLPDSQMQMPYEFGVNYLVSKFLSKWKGLNTGIDTESAALESWFAFEHQCANTNQKVNAMRASTDVELTNLISQIQLKISHVIGPRPRVSVFDECLWSRGATYATRRGATIPDKMIRPIATTRRNLPYIMREVLTDPTWCEAILGVRPEGAFSLTKACFSVVRGNRSVVVPKNAKTGRTISAEPAGNAFIQQGVGRFFRKRLKLFGVDLSDQTWNQNLASVAESRNLATLDLKGASDTVSRELIFLLLPIEWALFLDDIRSHETFLRGSWHRLQKFSSMGNAFTFELESLLFWAISCSVVGTDDRTQVSVYGDDIIVPAGNARSVIDALETFGFTINMDKSYVSGHFFESCGKHYFLGRDVTPAYQQELVSDLPELIRLTNRLIRWTYRMRDLDGSDPVKLIRLQRAITQKGLDLCKTLFGQQRPPLIPSDSVSDDGFLVDPSQIGSAWDKNRGFYCRVLRYVTVFGPEREVPFYAYKLRRPVYSNASREGRVEVELGGRWRFSNDYLHSWHEVLRY